MLDKRALRREIAAQKRALSPAQIEAASADLTAQLLAHPLFRAARSLYAYLSYNQEVCTLPLIRQAQALGKRVAVPKVYGENGHALFCGWTTRRASHPVPTASRSRSTTARRPTIRRLWCSCRVWPLTRGATGWAMAAASMTASSPLSRTRPLHCATPSSCCRSWRRRRTTSPWTRCSPRPYSHKEGIACISMPSVKPTRKGWLIWAAQCPSAFARGATENEALAKLPGDVRRFLRWAGEPGGHHRHAGRAIESGLHTEDADSDLLLEADCAPMTEADYAAAKLLVLRSARDFCTLFGEHRTRISRPAPAHESFYGPCRARRARCMTITNHTTAYYMAAFGIPFENMPDLYANRLQALAEIEDREELLTGRICTAPDGERWTLRKLLRASCGTTASTPAPCGARPPRCGAAPWQTPFGFR